MPSRLGCATLPRIQKAVQKRRGYKLPLLVKREPIVEIPHERLAGTGGPVSSETDDRSGEEKQRPAKAGFLATGE